MHSLTDAEWRRPSQMAEELRSRSLHTHLSNCPSRSFTPASTES